MKTTSSKILSEMVQKWIKRKEGHFAVYTKEGKKFLVPLSYLNHPIFRVLLEMAEEEFGTATRGPIQVPCEEEFMEHVFALLRKKIPSVQVESDHLISISSCESIPISSLLPS